MTESASTLSPETIQTVLSKGWMTHDAMWFVSCLGELGIERTNRLNRSAIAMMAAVETRRMLKALGMQDETFDTFDKVWCFFQGARTMVIPAWMHYTFERGVNDTIRWQWVSCFAHDGIERIGVIDRYECGVMYRIESWMKALGLRFEMTPEIRGCLMHERGECKGEIRFFFDH